MSRREIISMRFFDNGEYEMVSIAWLYNTDPKLKATFVHPRSSIFEEVEKQASVVRARGLTSGDE